MSSLIMLMTKCIYELNICLCQSIFLTSIDAIWNTFLLKEVPKCQHELNICLPTIFLPSIDVVQRGRGKDGKTQGLFIRGKSILSKFYYVPCKMDICHMCNLISISHSRDTKKKLFLRPLYVVI